jgi:hypothetical protein
MKVLALIGMCLVPLVVSTATAADDAVMMREARATAECVVEQQPAAVDGLLGTLPGSDQEVRAAERLKTIYAACSGDKFGLAINKGSQGLFNGRPNLAAAAASAALDKRDADVARLQGAQAWYANAVAGTAAGRGYDAVALGRQEFGTCVVKAAPDSALKLVRSRAGSAEEREALSGITPVLSGCIAAGTPISIKRDTLRLMIAEPLYHAIVDGPAAGRRS